MPEPIRLRTGRDDRQEEVIAKLELALDRAKAEGWTFVAVVGEGPDNVRTMLSGNKDVLRTIGALQQTLFVALHEWHHEDGER